MARYVIKLGSSIVAHDDGTLRAGTLEHLADVAARRRAAGDELVIVSSGAIARGMEVMGLKQRPSAIEDLQAASAVGQGKLFRVYDELLRARDVTAAQVLLTFLDLHQREHYLNARQTLRKLLDWGVVPIVNENDTTATDEISFGDNDFLAAQVAMLIDAEKLILLTGVDGLFSSDPRKGEAELISEVTDYEALEQLDIGSNTSTLGSGGMRSKVVAAEMATAAGIETVACNGLSDGALQRVLAGEREGTHFAARDLNYSSFKLWLLYAKRSHGTVVVDAGAARVLREDGTSLLPVGVVGIKGKFEPGDAVDVADDSGVIGKGIVNYSAAELKQVQGLKSAAVNEKLPGAPSEAVHRDYFVLA